MAWPVSLGLGAVVAFALPEPALWWLGWIGLAPIFVLVANRADRLQAHVEEALELRVNPVSRCEPAIQGASNKVRRP